MVNFKNMNLIFSERKIVTEEMSSEVMAAWEEPVMKKHVDVACKMGGDVLEIGFGMGLSANFIQDKNVKSHTIVEIHPQICKMAKDWAKDKSNVTILEGDWFQLVEKIVEKKYDSIIFDTHLDENRHTFRSKIVDKCLLSGGIFTYFNIGENIEDVYNYGTRLQYAVVDVKPDKDCTYYFSNRMFVPYIKY